MVEEQHCHERRVSIITLNYDTLLESAILSITIGKDTNGKDRRLYLDDIYPVAISHNSISLLILAGYNSIPFSNRYLRQNSSGPE